MSEAFQTIGLIGKYGTPDAGGVLLDISRFLKSLKLRVLVDTSTLPLVPHHDMEIATREEIGRHCDLAIVVGGDGTLLNAARSLVDHEVPLLGINQGRLGFLVDVSPSKMQETLGEILRGVYVTEERLILHAVIERDATVLSESDAFNEVAAQKASGARMIELETFVNGQFVHIIRADGLVISTPTGSTAYAMSCGGPILHPGLNAIAMVPICPHTLSNRPVVISGDSSIEVLVREATLTDVHVTCDGQINVGLLPGDRLKIQKKRKPVRLVHPANYDYFEILRAKLRWGERI